MPLCNRFEERVVGYATNTDHSPGPSAQPGDEMHRRRSRGVDVGIRLSQGISVLGG